MPRLAGWMADDRLQFVIVNVAVNLLMLGRSYAAMRVLDAGDLGIVTLFQTVMLVIGLLHFGMLQGGFRLQCDRDPQLDANVNATAYACFALVGLVTVAIALAGALALPQGMSAAILLAATVAGLATLLRSWITNQHIAAARLPALNRITLLTTLGSLLPLLAIPVAPLEALLASFLLQPFLFVLAGLVRNRDFRPARLHLDWRLLRRMIAVGFALFLTGLLVHANMVMERSFVTATFGLEGLGRLFLAYLFVTLFQLVPSSLDGVFLPRIVASSQAGNAPDVSRQLRLYLFVSLGYCAIAAAGMYLLAEPLVDLLLPDRSGDLVYAKLLLPGLLLFTLASPLALTFNTLVAYRTYYWAYGTGTLFTAVALGLWSFGRATTELALDDVMSLRSLVWALMGAAILVGYVGIARRHPIFRLHLLARRRA